MRNLWTDHCLSTARIRPTNPAHFMTPLKVPPLGESVVEATIGRWLKKEGDAVQTGETIVELETDKINVEVPAQKAGVLTKRLKNEGDVVKVDETLAEIDESGTAGGGAGSEKAAPAAASAEAAPPAATAAAPAAQSGGSQQEAGSKSTAPDPGKANAPAAAATPATASSAPQAGQGSSGAAKLAPSAQRLAAEENVDLSKVQGTGRGGVVSKSDVIEQRGAADASSAAQSGAQPTPKSGSAAAPSSQSAAQSGSSGFSPQPAVQSGAGSAPKRVSGKPAERETREKMTTRRKKIAEHLLEAKNATASLTTFNEVDMTALNQLRDKFKEKVEKEHAVKLTFMPFFVRAACMALKTYPVANATIDGDSIVYRHYVNMGIAVASEQGLIVPNLKEVDSKGILDISRDIAAVAKRARDNKLTMDDLTGGTFTITNGGVFGSLVSTPILNYPQVAILGMHKIQDRPVAIDGKVEIRPMMYLALTYDHRIIDGQQAVLFLVRLKELIEEPAAMLID